MSLLPAFSSVENPACWIQGYRKERLVMVLLVISTLVVAAITGVISLGEDELFCGVAGQVGHTLLSTACFALVGVAFWRFGWQVGVIDLALVFVASNVSLTLCRYFGERSGLRD